MTRDPYGNVKRVFWIVDNSSSHAGQASIERLQTEWSNLVLVHLPFHASRLNQIELVFSVIQRKVLTLNDFASLQAIVDRLDPFEHHYKVHWNGVAIWFTRRDLEALIVRVAQYEPRLTLAA